MKQAFFCFFIFCHSVFGNNLPYYEELASNAWTDHVRCFNALFELQRIDVFLEFGLGRGTEFYLDHCGRVTSIELVVESRRSVIEPWYEKCLDNFKNYTNWNPSIHYFSSNFDLADHRAQEQLDPASIDSAYLSEIDALCDRIFVGRHFDAAFVDPGIYIRGDIVNALFNRVDIIAAHDTACTVHQMYGYYKVKCPDNYEEIVSKYGSGTTFWIKKDKKQLIEKLKHSLLIEANN